MTDYQKNLQILRNIEELPDNRGLLARIFCERTFAKEAVQKIVRSVSGLSLEDFLGSSKDGAFYLEDPDKIPWEMEAYSFEQLCPPKMSKKAGPDYFELIDDGSNYKLKIVKVNAYQRIYKTGKRPENQRVIRTSDLSEVNELLGQGFCLKSTNTIYEEIPCGLDGETATETVSFIAYTLVKKK